jgi:gas vesicle protein
MASDDQNTVIIKIDVDSGPAKKSIGDAEKKVGDSSKRIGKSVEVNVSQRLNKSFSLLKLSVIGLGASLVAALGSKRVIDAAIKQENSVNRLNQAMASAGRFSREASKDFQNLASELQKSSVVGDEVILNSMAVASQFTRTNEETKKLTKAALDLSAATGKSLDDSVRTLGMTLNGQLGTLGRSVAGVKGLTEAQLRAGAAIDIVAGKFAGSALAQTRTFGGAITQLSNVWGDLQEVIGGFITNSGPLRGVINFISGAITKLTDSITELAGQGRFDQFIIDAIQFSQALNTLILKPLEFVFNAANIVFDGIKIAVQSFLGVIVGAAAKVSEFFSPNSEITKNLIMFKESVDEVFVDLVKTAGESIDNLFNMNVSEKSAQFLEDMRIAATTAGSNFKDPINQALNETEIASSLTFQNIKNAFITEMSSVQIKAQDVAKTMYQTLGTGAANAFAAFGRAVATGQNAMSALLNSALNTFGQVAVNLGQQFVLQGVAHTWAGIPGGPSLIAAGAALAAFGGFLSGVGGGSVSAGATAGGGGTSGISSQPEMITPDDTEDRKPQNQITVQIQGDVLDSDETGLRIVDLISEYVDRNGNGVVLA